MVIAWPTIAAAVAVAYANGANDVSKGVGTLVGSRLATYGRALGWGALWTAAGATAALSLSGSMLKMFSTGLVARSIAQVPAFPLAVATGAFVWVLIASRTGLPVSTTHSLTGAILGAAVVLDGTGRVRWMPALKTVAVPLAFSPLVAALVAYGLHAVLSRRLAAASRYCLCAQRRALMISGFGHERRRGGTTDFPPRRRG
jgi:inorganic phosphate transporter, PiT family